MRVQVKPHTRSKPGRQAFVRKTIQLCNEVLDERRVAEDLSLELTKAFAIDLPDRLPYQPTAFEGS